MWQVKHKVPRHPLHVWCGLLYSRRACQSHIGILLCSNNNDLLRNIQCQGPDSVPGEIKINLGSLWDWGSQKTLVFWRHCKKYYPSRAFGLKRSDFSHQKGLGKPLTVKNRKHICPCTYCHVADENPPHFHRGGRQAALVPPKPWGKLALPLMLAPTQEDMYRHTLNTGRLWHQKLCLCVLGGWSLF